MYNLQIDLLSQVQERFRAVNKLSFWWCYLRSETPAVEKPIPKNMTQEVPVRPLDPARKIFQAQTQILWDKPSLVLDPATSWAFQLVREHGSNFCLFLLVSFER